MAKKRKRKQSDDNEANVASWMEWQNHQYDPGHYVGRPHPIFTNNRAPRLFGWFLVISAGGFAVLAIVGTIISGNGWPRITSWLPGGLFLGLYFLAGLRFLQKGRR